ncbi:gas vesicle protein GvpO [Streptomyces sp. NPDC003038]|uniref:gas vesicle protein GvpO n=1 Tax=unclassified Streptomyces TaxID=2593676 RepID=UPI0033B26B68
MASTSENEKPDQAEREQEPEQEEQRLPGTVEIIRSARRQLVELIGVEAETVSACERTAEGWTLSVEVVELERVPDTMSLLASYTVELDRQGELTGYRRHRRYERGRADRK